MRLVPERSQSALQTRWREQVIVIQEQTELTRCPRCSDVSCDLRMSCGGSAKWLVRREHQIELRSRDRQLFDILGAVATIGHYDFNRTNCLYKYRVYCRSQQF